jgi:DNA-binding MarR family transcriptional regulator
MNGRKTMRCQFSECREIALDNCPDSFCEKHCKIHREIEGQTMRYEQFDTLKGRNTEENVIALLRQNPYTLSQLAELTGLDRTTIHYQMKKLILKGIVEAKGFGKYVFYGLTKKGGQR